MTGGLTTEKTTSDQVESVSFDRLREEWSVVLSQAVTPFPFQSIGWAESWWRTFGADAALVLLRIADADDCVIGIAPLMIRETGLGRTVQFIGGSDVTDYLDIIAAEADLHRVWQATLDALFAIRAQWDALDFHCLPAWSPSSQVIAALLSERMAVRVAQEEVCPLIQLGGSFDTYLRGLEKKERHEIRRKARNFERDVPTGKVRIVTEREAALAALPEFFRLHRLSAPDKERFLTPDVEQFFAAITAATADAGTLRLFFLDIDALSVAAMYTFVAGGRVLVYNSGYDPAFSRVSAGMVLTGMVIEDAAAQGLAVCDFLRGNEVYKYRFGATDTPIWRVVAADDGVVVDRAVAEMEAALQTPADVRDLHDDERAQAEVSA